VTSLFSPDSAIRRIGSESVLMFGGGRALLMQVGNPVVASAVRNHSAYATEPWRRLARTMTALYTIVLGTKEEAERARGRRSGRAALGARNPRRHRSHHVRDVRRPARS
jgi:uncharacterized protein (DUF2236 family)